MVSYVPYSGTSICAVSRPVRRGKRAKKWSKVQNWQNSHGSGIQQRWSIHSVRPPHFP